MLKFAIKNMAVKKLQIVLIVLSIVISAGVGVLAYNVAEQVSDGISGTAGYYSAIIGPAGSKTQLAMNTMYFTDEPLGTIPYSVVEELSSDMRVREVIPFAMADSYNGSSVVGTSPAFLSEKSLASGEMFSADGAFEVVVGSAVAKMNELEIGDVIQLGKTGEGYYHTLLVVGFEGEDILVAAQTDNAFARPLSSYENDYERYIKILGVRVYSDGAADCFESVYEGIAIIPEASAKDAAEPKIPNKGA